MQRLCLICYLYLRIQPGEPVPGIADRELPAGRPRTLVAIALPGPRRPPRLVDVGDAGGKAMTHGAADPAPPCPARSRAWACDRPRSGRPAARPPPAGTPRRGTPWSARSGCPRPGPCALPAGTRRPRAITESRPGPRGSSWGSLARGARTAAARSTRARRPRRCGRTRGPGAPGLAGRGPREWATSWREPPPGRTMGRAGRPRAARLRARLRDASGTHHSLTPGALPRLLQVVRDRGGAHRLDVPELDGLVREQADRPVVVALRRVRAREGDDPRLDVPVDLEVSRG